MQCIEPKSGKGESRVQNAMDFQPTLPLCGVTHGLKILRINLLKGPRTAVKKFERNMFIWWAALYIKYFNTDLLTALLYPSVTAQKLVSSTVTRRLCSLKWVHFDQASAIYSIAI